MNRERTLNSQNGINRVQKSFCSWAITVATFVAIGFIACGEKAMAKGLLMGTFFSVINFILMGRSASIILGRSRIKARFIGLASILSRFLLLAIPLIIAIKSVYFDFLSVIIGIFAVQIIIFFYYVILRQFLYQKNRL